MNSAYRSGTIGGNWEMDKLYTTTQVSSVKTENKEHTKLHLFYPKISTLFQNYYYYDFFGHKN